MKDEGIQLTSEIYDTVMRAFYIYCRYAQGGYLFRVQPDTKSVDTPAIKLDSNRLDISELKVTLNQFSIFPQTFRSHFQRFNVDISETDEI